MKKGSGLKEAFSMPGKYPGLTLLCIICGIALSCMYLYLTPSEYTSTCVLANTYPATESNQSFFNNTQNAVTEEITSTQFITNALHNKIDAVSYYVTSDFKKSYNAYAFPFNVKHEAINQKFKEQAYHISNITDKTFVLTSTLHGLTRQKSGTFGEELIDQDLALTITKKEKAPYFSEALIQSPLWSFTIQSPEALATSLIEKSQGIDAFISNGVIKISSTHESATKAQQICKAVAAHFINTRNNITTSEEVSTVSFDTQLLNLSKQLEDTENQIALYKKQNNISDINFETEKTFDILKSLQIQKSQLKLNLAALNNTSDYLRKNREINNSNVDYGTINDPVFSEQIALLNSKYNAPENTQGGSINNQEIESIKNTIAERILNTRKKVTIQINKLNQEIYDVKNQIAYLPEQATILNSLNRKLELDKKVYDLIADRRAQVLVKTNVTASTAKILKPASTPSQPSFPAAWLFLAAGAISGLIVSILSGLFINRINTNRIASRKEISNQSRIPYIGTISREKSNSNGIDASLSALCTKVLLLHNTKMITFASTGKGEGKTFIATHFAQAFAAMDKKVLVLDMNIKNPAVASHFDVTPDRSLSDVLAGTCDIHDAISITSFPNLDILETGDLPSGVNSLLASNKRTSILEGLKNHYDLIVTDTPDVGTNIEAIPMMKLSDLNLYIINSNTTRKQSLETAEQVNKDYELENFYFLLNTVNHSSTKNKVRNINSSSAKPNEGYIPTMLQKAALWFY